jgi:hypothetical protein
MFFRCDWRADILFIARGFIIGGSNKFSSYPICSQNAIVISSLRLHTDSRSGRSLDASPHYSTGFYLLPSSYLHFESVPIAVTGDVGRVLLYHSLSGRIIANKFLIPVSRRPSEHDCSEVAELVSIELSSTDLHHLYLDFVYI